MQQCTEINLLTLQKLIEKTTPQQKLNTVQQKDYCVTFFLGTNGFRLFFWLGQAVHNYKETGLSSCTMLKTLLQLSNTRHV